MTLWSSSMLICLVGYPHGFFWNFFGQAGKKAVYLTMLSCHLSLMKKTNPGPCPSTGHFLLMVFGHPRRRNAQWVFAIVTKGTVLSQSDICSPSMVYTFKESYCAIYVNMSTLMLMSSMSWFESTVTRKKTHPSLASRKRENTHMLMHKMDLLSALFLWVDGASWLDRQRQFRQWNVNIVVKTCSSLIFYGFQQL